MIRVITSYSIHYTKLYDRGQGRQVATNGGGEFGALKESHGHPEVAGQAGARFQNAAQPAGDRSFPAGSVLRHMGQNVV